MAEIRYAKPAEWSHWGRNGAFQAGGLSINPTGNDEIVLQGLSSRGWSNAADLVIPKSEIDAVIKLLESAK